MEYTVQLWKENCIQRGARRWLSWFRFTMYPPTKGAADLQIIIMVTRVRGQDKGTPWMSSVVKCACRLPRWTSTPFPIWLQIYRPFHKNAFFLCSFFIFPHQTCEQSSICPRPQCHPITFSSQHCYVNRQHISKFRVPWLRQCAAAFQVCPQGY